MSGILLADNFPLPPAAVTESIFIGGRKGSGKTNTAELLFEQMFELGAQCVALDPVGPWYSLRLSASGKRAGLKIPIFGGDHGDIPITPQGGRLLAKSIVDSRTSCVIDLMNFRPTQRKEFSRDFAQELFELKKKKKNPLHLFVEEARLFAPQFPKSAIDVEMCDAFEQIVRLGRNYGLGVSLLDQRPQSVNKEVTSQTEVLIVHQITEKLGRKEIEDWVRAKSVAGGEGLEQLAELRTGEAFVWSPGLLRKFAKIKVHKKRTYDASKTPELGESDQAEPQPLSSKELQALKEAMASVVQEAEANDPGHLRKQVVDLKREILQQQNSLEALGKEKHVVPSKVVEHIIEKPVVNKAQVVAIERSIDRGEKALARAKTVTERAEQLADRAVTAVTTATAAVTESSNRIADELAKLRASLAQVLNPKPTFTPAAVPVVAKAKEKPRAAVVEKRPAGAPVETDGKPSKAEANILRALAWLGSIGITAPRSEAVAFLAGYSPRGGYFNNSRGAMRTKGWIDYMSDGSIVLTDTGTAIAPRIDRPMSIKEMHDAVLAVCSKAEKQLLVPLLEAWPKAITNDELAQAAGYDAKGGYFNNTRGRLRTIGLLDYPSKGLVRAEDYLFPGA
jgi:hypothetical protein